MYMDQVDMLYEGWKEEPPVHISLNAFLRGLAGDPDVNKTVNVGHTDKDDWKKHLGDPRESKQLPHQHPQHRESVVPKPFGEVIPFERPLPKVEDLPKIKGMPDPILDLDELNRINRESAAKRLLRRLKGDENYVPPPPVFDTPKDPIA